MDKESIEYDVVIVGGGPAGLAAAIKLRQLASAQDIPLAVCLLEKASEIGAHILSGAVLDLHALDELLPDWQERNAPLDTPVSSDRFYFIRPNRQAIRIPRLFTPPSMHNDGNYIIRAGHFCRWLGQQAEAGGVDLFPGFPAAGLLFNDQGAVCGVTTADQGVAADGQHKSSYTAGINVLAKHVIIAEGSRGHLGRQLCDRFGLDNNSDPQHYALGLKEHWKIDPANHRSGLVVHATGWPLNHNAGGGAFMYHLDDNQVSIGLIVDLNYSNPYLDPFNEFQQMKLHPLFSTTLAGGKRLYYGARSITKGGYNALPNMSVPGALLIGCDAGTLDFSRIKGIHTAMKSGMVAAETIINDLELVRNGGRDLVAFNTTFGQCWAGKELYQSRNFGPALHRFGNFAGGIFNYLDQCLFKGRMPFTLRDQQADHRCIQAANQSEKITYPKPDNKLSFDRPSSVYLSNTTHERDQPCHLLLNDKTVPVTVNLANYDGLEQRYCPAGVYEFIVDTEVPRLQINADNCIHCKTCDIKDPLQNITWVTPEGGSGPNYPGM